MKPLDDIMTTRPPRRYANITNGLAWPHDDVCHFLSTHGHNYQMGYLRLDSMPYSAVIELLCGRPIEIIDASASGKSLSDALRFGLTTWVLIFNRALRCRDVVVATWQTAEMKRAAHHARVARKIVRRIRRLQSVFGDKGPVRIGPSEAVRLQCYQHCSWDDKPHELQTLALEAINDLT